MLVRAIITTVFWNRIICIAFTRLPRGPVAIDHGLQQFRSTSKKWRPVFCQPAEGDLFRAQSSVSGAKSRSRNPGGSWIGDLRSLLLLPLVYHRCFTRIRCPSGEIITMYMCRRAAAPQLSTRFQCPHSLPGTPPTNMRFPIAVIRRKKTPSPRDTAGGLFGGGEVPGE